MAPISGTFSKLAIMAIVMVAALLCQPLNSMAQSYGSAIFSALPVRSLERYMGPLLPKEGFGNTFRSEAGTSMILGALQEARLKPQDASMAEIDIRTNSLGLDEYPTAYEAHSTLRLWRLGFRVGYSHFENKSLQIQKGKIISNGFRLGGAFDAIHLDWLTVGVAADHYFYEPQLRGNLVFTTNTKDDYFELSAGEPTTVGPYMRYAPPEILGFPMHFECYYNIPVSDTRYSNLGAAFVFRPQIYRFDVSAKLIWERRNLSFSGEQSPAQGDDLWDLSCEWNMLGFEAGVYF